MTYAIVKATEEGGDPIRLWEDGHITFCDGLEEAQRVANRMSEHYSLKVFKWAEVAFYEKRGKR